MQNRFVTRTADLGRPPDLGFRRRREEPEKGEGQDALAEPDFPTRPTISLRGA